MVLRIKPEKKEEKERVTLALLRSTLSLAAVHGFSSLGLREVSRAAEIAPTSFYRHFSDMEQLGLALISEVVGQRVRVWIDKGRAASTRGSEIMDAIADQAFSTVTEDPELVRFILAERMGAMPALRAALARELGLLSAAIQAAFAAERTDGLGLPESVSDAAVALMLEGCGRALEQGGAGDVAARQQLELQLRVLLRGAQRTT